MNPRKELPGKIRENDEEGTRILFLHINNRVNTRNNIYQF